MNLLALYLREFNRSYLTRPADRCEAFWTITVFLLGLTVAALILWQAPSLETVLEAKP